MKKLMEFIFVAVVLTTMGCDDSSSNTPDDTGSQTIDTTAILSQAALIKHLDGTVYQTEQEYESGINPDGVVMGKWKIVFSESQFDWSYSDTIEKGSYSYIAKNSMMVTLDNTSFEVTLDPVENKFEWMDKTYVLAE